MAQATMSSLSIAKLRSHAIRRTLKRFAHITDAVSHLGFVQADPIRAPARAQDLILRPRVDNYRAGDLEQHYPTLPLCEDVLHVYGFLPQQHLTILHPRPLSGHWQRFVDAHPSLQKDVLALVTELGVAHPKAVEKALGKLRRENGWGGQSSATTMMLEALHQQGRLRVARREGGLRLYTTVRPEEKTRALHPATRAKGLCRLLASLYAPMPLRSLQQALLAVRGPSRPTPRDALHQLLANGELRQARIDAEDWVWPEAETDEILQSDEQNDAVVILAPFDPLVWDRRRFSLLWGWDYRFEAYTPAAKRKLGYYALPLLFRDQVVGAANLTVQAKTLHSELRLVTTRPTEPTFSRALERELAAMATFLRLDQPSDDSPKPATANDFSKNALDPVRQAR